MVVLDVPEVKDRENDQKSDENSHLISPLPSAHLQLSRPDFSQNYLHLSGTVGRHPLLPISRSIAELLIEQPTVMAFEVSIVKSNIMRRTSYPMTL